MGCILAWILVDEGMEEVKEADSVCIGGLLGLWCGFGGGGGGRGRVGVEEVAETGSDVHGGVVEECQKGGSFDHL